MHNSNNGNAKHSFLRRGEAQVWVASAALSTLLLIAIILVGVIMFNGLGVFWPTKLAQFTLHDQTAVLGEIHQEEEANPDAPARLQLKVGNRDLYGLDFRWIDLGEEPGRYPSNAVTFERMEYGNFYGFIDTLDGPLVAEQNDSPWTQFSASLQIVHDQLEDVHALDARIRNKSYKSSRAAGQEKEAIESELTQLVLQRDARQSELMQNVVVVKDASGTTNAIPLAEIVRAYPPNQMSTLAKIGLYAEKLWELFFSEPREANTEGGLFPAIFGTISLVFIMSIFSFPLGVVAGIYLREYAKPGLIVRLVRICVNNLAGVPSIVYGIFGLGFFVYGVGGAIDNLFFADRFPTPTFGTGGILWASLTLGLLTVPVVIVATEEALGTIPQGIREGSLSLGATKFQTLIRVLLPIASPGIMTGFILAMARAAGEVAPLMITGVVKLAPTLPLDGHFPFFHAERKFMHLGFHIYDIGFQSPNVEAAKPMVFVTTLLLVLIVLLMSSLAIYLRNHMKRKYTVNDF